MYITHGQHFIEPHILYVDTDDIFVVYLGVDGQVYIATKTSMFEVNNIYANVEFRGIPLSEITIGVRCMIDNVKVSRQTFEKVRDLLQTNTIYGDGKQADSVYFDELYYDERENTDMAMTFEKNTDPILSTIEDCERLSNDILANWYLDAITNKYHRKDNNMITNIPKIVDYKYIAENGVTIIKWSDSTSTTVTCDPKTADQYTGFVTAIAKKAFGNGGKMLSEWDRLVIKPIEDAKKAEEKAKIEAEKKAKEDKIHAEAKAKRDAKKAKRKKQREIEKLAKQIADEYYAQELTEEAEKLAVKKYGVPKSYLDDYDCDCDNRKGNCDNCNCNEFDIMDDENITD